MKRLVSIKKEKAVKKKLKPKSKKGIVLIIIFFVLVIGAGAGIYYFFIKDSTEEISKEQKTEIISKVENLLNNFTRDLKKTALGDKRAVSPYLSSGSEEEVLNKSIPEGWKDYDKVRVGETEVMDINKAMADVYFPLQSPYENKYMIVKYEVFQLKNQWLIVGVESQTIIDHDITLWPLYLGDYDLLELQAEVFRKRESWALDPMTVVKKFAPFNGFLPDDRFELISEMYQWVPERGNYQAVVKAEHQDQTFFIILGQPLRKGFWGIWQIDRIVREKPDY